MKNQEFEGIMKNVCIELNEAINHFKNNDPSFNWEKYMEEFMFKSLESSIATSLFHFLVNNLKLEKIYIISDINYTSIQKECVFSVCFDKSYHAFNIFQKKSILKSEIPKALKRIEEHKKTLSL